MTETKDSHLQQRSFFLTFPLFLPISLSHSRSLSLSLPFHLSHLLLSYSPCSLSLESIIDADIAAAVPLISMGALLGRTTPIQLLCMSIFEIALFAANEYLALNVLSVSRFISVCSLCVHPSIQNAVSPLDLRLRWFHYGARLWRLLWPGCGSNAASCCRPERCWQA